MKEKEKAKELPKQAKVIALLSLVERSMYKQGLSWRDITKELVGESCPLCESRIRLCLSCKQEVSVGHKNCIHCGATLEKVEIEPTLR